MPASSLTARWRERVRRSIARTQSSSPRATVGSRLLLATLLALPAIALSNVALAVTALATPWKEVLPRWRVGRALVAMIVLYLLLLAGSILASHDPLFSLRAGSDLFNFLVPLLTLLLVSRLSQAQWLSRALIVTGCLVALHALAQYALGANQLSHRPTGPFSHYMTLGGYLVLVDCFLLAWLAFGDGWKRWQAWLALALIQAALLVSLTRNAWIALALLVTVVTLLRRPKLVVVWAPILLVVVLAAPTPIIARFGSIFDLSERSNYDRLCMAHAGASMVVDRPLLGHGPRTVRTLYPFYRDPSAPSLWVPHLHNSFLNLGAERGLLALAAFLGMLGVCAHRAFARLARSRSGAEREILAAVLLLILASLVTGLFEDYWNDTEIQRLLLYALALPFGLAEEEGHPVEGDEAPG